MHVPAHVHNDTHGPGKILGKLDSLEQWTKKDDCPHPSRQKGRANITIWNSDGMDAQEPEKDWTPQNVGQKLAAFIHRIASFTHGFRSVDSEGSRDDQKKKGKLTDEECFAQAKVLIPKATQETAQMIVNFLHYNRTQWDGIDWFEGVSR